MSVTRKSDSCINLASWYRKKKILVTGGAGFIGSHLVEKLVDYDAQVTVIDNLSTGSLQNLAQVHHAITFIPEDIISSTYIAKAVHEQEIIFHCAALADVPECQTNLLSCYRINVDGTALLLQKAYEARCQRFIFSSSAAVYGTYEIPCSEDFTKKPISHYGVSKLAGEELCIYAQRTYGIGTLALRYFNVYDPFISGRSQKGIYALMHKALRSHQPITIFGDGLQSRDFVSVHEVVHANLLLATLPLRLLTGQAINIASGKTITLIELFNRLKILYPDYPYHLTFLPSLPGDIFYSSACCHKLRTYLQRAEDLLNTMDYTNDARNDIVEQATTI